MYLDFTFKVASLSIALHKFKILVASSNDGEMVQRHPTWMALFIIIFCFNIWCHPNHSRSPSDIHILKRKERQQQEGLTIYSRERKLEKSFNLHLQNRTTSSSPITQSTIKGKQRNLHRSTSHQMIDAF